MKNQFSYKTKISEYIWILVFWMEYYENKKM